MKVSFYCAITVFFLLLPHQVAAKQIMAKVDRQSIGLNETFWLTVTTDLQTTNEPLDFSELEIQFDILSNQQKNQYQIVNGRTSSIREWRLLLAPKEVGKFVIPSFRLGNLYSEAITVDVYPQPEATSSGALSEVFLESFVNKETVYVQQEILFTLRLLTRVSLTEIKQTDLKVKDAIVEPMPEKRYSRIIGNRNYTVLEEVYVIIPQTSGSIIVPSIKWQLEKIPKSLSFSLDPFDSLQKSDKNNNSPIVRLSSQPHKVSVLPVPGSYRGRHWLPVSQLTIEETWSNETADNHNNTRNDDELEAIAGEPINRTITIRAKGVSGEQISPLPQIESDDVKIYSSLPKIETEKTSLGQTGVRTENYSVIPIKPGLIHLPEITVSWWDTETNEEKVSVLPGKTLSVKGAALAPDAETFNADSSGAAKNLADETATGASDKLNQPAPSTPALSIMGKANHLVIIVTSIVAASALLIIWLAFWQRRRKKNITEGKETTKHISEKCAFQQLCKVLSEQDLPLIRRHLITWAQVYSNDESITQLNDVASIFPEAAGNVIKALDQQLYGKTHDRDEKSDQWRPEELLACVKQQRKMKMAKTVKSSLKPVYL